MTQPEQTSPLSTAASRRNVVRGAIWTTAAVTVVVATPNIAAASGPAPATIISAQREGSNFRLKVKAPTGKTIDTVMIGDVTAKFSKQFEEYTARLSNESDNTQAVFITYTDGTTYTTSVTFRP